MNTVCENSEKSDNATNTLFLDSKCQNTKPDTFLEQINFAKASTAPKNLTRVLVNSEELLKSKNNEKPNT